MKWIVQLRSLYCGNPWGSTHDVVEAETAEEAEAKALADWREWSRKNDPRFTYQPLVTTYVREEAK